MSESQRDEIVAMVDAMHQALAGHPAESQGFALADALATWVAGHVVPYDPEETWALQAAILKAHVGQVVDMIQPRMEAIHGNQAR